MEISKKPNFTTPTIYHVTDDLPSIWEELLPDYIKSSMDYWICPQDQSKRGDFEKKFHKLRELDTGSFAPFYPIFLSLLDSLDDASIHYFIQEGQSCDYHLTNACCTRYLQSLQNENRKKEIYAILQKFYPEDINIKAVMNEKYDLTAQLNQMKNSLQANLKIWNEGAPGNEMVKFLQHSREIAGFKFLQPWVTLAWALKGNVKAAKIALARSFTQLDKNFSSDYLQKIMVSFISFEGEQEFLCSEMEKHPYCLQIQAFIEIMESSPLDAKRVTNFIDRSIESIEKQPDALVFLYFGLQHLLKANLANCKGGFKIFEAIVRLQQVVEKDKKDLFHYDKSKIPTANPSFKFDSSLSLTKNSKLSLASSISSQCSLLLTTLYNQSMALHGPSLFLPIPLLTEKEIELLSKSALTLDHGSFTFYTALNHLRNYWRLPSEERPYTLKESFLSWAEFAIFASSTPQFLDTPLDQKILKHYYPKMFKKALFETYHNLALKLSNPDLHEFIPLAVRDILLANCDLNHTNNQTPKIENPYKAYLLSKRYFQWRTGESFKQWGKRIKTQKYPDHEILRLFHEFWLEFHQKCSTPNGKSQIPTDRPECIREKEMPEEKFLKLLGALLITHTEDPDQPVRAMVENRDQAIKLCQILLETAVDRLVRRALVTEPEHPKKALSQYLPMLHNTFQGPSNNCYEIGIATSSNFIAKTYIFFN